MEARKLPGFTDLVKESWAIYTSNIKLFLKLVLLSILFVVLTGLFGAGSVLVFLGSNLTPVLVILGIVIVLVAIVSQVWVQLSLVLSVKLITDGKTPKGVRELLTSTKPLLLPSFGIAAISLFLILGGYLLFIIPGILFSIWFGFCTYVLVSENKRGIAALLTSRDYIEGSVLSVLGRIILFGILTSVVSSVPSFIFKQADAQALSSIYSMLVSLAVTPLSIIFSFLLYKALKAKKPDLKVDLSQSRKLKYIGVAAAGYLLVIGGVLLLAFGGR